MHKERDKEFLKMGWDNIYENYTNAMPSMKIGAQKMLTSSWIKYPIANRIILLYLITNIHYQPIGMWIKKEIKYLKPTSE